jgi:hypothetical protein
METIVERFGNPLKNASSRGDDAGQIPLTITSDGSLCTLLSALM